LSGAGRSALRDRSVPHVPAQDGIAARGSGGHANLSLMDRASDLLATARRTDRTFDPAYLRPVAPDRNDQSDGGVKPIKVLK